MAGKEENQPVTDRSRVNVSLPNGVYAGLRVLRKNGDDDIAGCAIRDSGRVSGSLRNRRMQWAV